VSSWLMTMVIMHGGNTKAHRAVAINVDTVVTTNTNKNAVLASFEFDPLQPSLRSSNKNDKVRSCFF
jgi:hypothetical protein